MKLCKICLLFLCLAGCATAKNQLPTAAEISDMRSNSMYGCVAVGGSAVGGIANGAAKAAFAWCPENPTEQDKTIIQKLLDKCGI